MNRYQITLRVGDSTNTETRVVEGEAIVEVLMKAQRDYEYYGRYDVIGIIEL